MYSRCLLYRHTDNNVFDDFPKISDHFLEILEYSPKLVRGQHERFWSISEKFRRVPKISEDDRRLPKTFEEYPKMFECPPGVRKVMGPITVRDSDFFFVPRSCHVDQFTFHKFKDSLRLKNDISEVIDIFTSDDMENTPPESQMWFCMNFTRDVFSSKTLVSL